MPELENVEAQKTAGYMSRSRSKYKDKIKKEEEELKQLMEQQGQATEEKTKDKVEEAKPEVELSDEEKSFKTRYGDVRRHLAAKEKEYNAKIITIVIRGNAFLYRQIRNMVGCLVHVGQGKLCPKDVKLILHAKDRTHSQFVTAPAKGLFLYNVEHGDFHL